MLIPFEVSVVLLAGLLFLPVSKLIWVFSVRRLEKRTGQTLDDATRQGQLTRARFIAVFVCLLFSWLFNSHLSSTLGGG